MLTNARNHADQCNSVAPGCCEPKSSSMTEGENPLATFFSLRCGILLRHKRRAWPIFLFKRCAHESAFI